jgi:delta 1-pyrroline-5-carboxylate dehydrogenase
MATEPTHRPHPIYLGGRWVESPERLVIDNPARPAEPAGSTYNATPEQYEEAVTAAVAAFERTRKLPAFEQRADLGSIAAGMQEGDLQVLGGWRDRSMLSRYGASAAVERALAVKKKLDLGKQW